MSGVEYYTSPRITAEVADCSMPMTFDQYSTCAFGCLYCFSQFQRAIGAGAKDYLGHVVRAVNVEKVKRLFLDPSSNKELEAFVRQRIVMQWGGLSDPFCPLEKKFGVGLELLRFFKEINYPLSLSTKGTWWTKDSRCTELFRGQKNWNVKISIITLDPHKAKVIERGVDTPSERLEAMSRVAGFGAGGVTLRLRPFIVGVSSPDHVMLIRRAGEAGATALSTEFFCMEGRSKELRKKLPVLSQCAGFDLWNFYKKNSTNTGYMRLNRNAKRQFVDEMEAACAAAGMRFYVSDAHFKERCANGSCCGLPPSWGYSRGQFTEAVLLCKKNGTVRWAEIAEHMEPMRRLRSNCNSCKVGQASSEWRARWLGRTLFDVLRWYWNNPMAGQSPYRMYEGIMKPVGLDDEGNVIYGYDKERE